MTLLISPTEPAPLRALGSTSSKPEKYGCDFLIMAKSRKIGVQRKQFPDDFLASLTGDRFARLLPLMAKLERKVLVVEGHGQWTNDGELVSPIRDFQRFSLKAMHAITFTIMWQFGIPVIWVKDMRETEELVGDMERWLGKDKHQSILTRPGAPRDSWGQIGDRAWATYFMQGFPGVGVDTAGRIVDHFEGVPLTFTHTAEELMEVSGVGKGIVGKMIGALERVLVKEGGR